MTPGFQLEWNIEGDKSLSRKLRGFEDSVKDMRQPFGQAADYLWKLFKGPVFDTKGGVIGERWARLSPATVAAKARRGYSTEPLVRTGAMRQSFRTAVSSDQAVIYNTADYFKYHQSNRRRSYIPRRVMMKIGENQKEQVIKYFHTFIHGQMRKRF